MNKIQEKTFFGKLFRNLMEEDQSGLDIVPEEERDKDEKSLFNMWFSANINFATLTSGILATAVFGLSLYQAILGLAVGAAIGGACIGVVSRYGPRFGAIQSLQSRAPFGFFGNFLVALFVIANGVGWFAVLTVLGAFILQTLFGMSVLLAFFLILAVQIMAALIGHNLIHTIQKVLVYLLPVLTVAATYFAFKNADYGKTFDIDALGGIGFSAAFMLTVTVQSARAMSFASFASDYSRYIKKSVKGSSIFMAATSGAFLASFWVSAVGAAIGTFATVGSPSDFVGIALPALVAWLCLAGFGLSNIMCACLDCYSGGMAAQLLNLPMSRWFSVLLVGIIGGLLGWLGLVFGFWESFKIFLFILGYWIGPWLGVMVVYFDYIHRNKAIDLNLFYDKTHKVSVGLVAWVLGFVASVPFMSQQLYTGFVASAHPSLGDITPLIGFIVAGIVAYIGFTLKERNKELAPVSISENSD